jgi:diguanylate cyclase (GGDEF)-like protein
MQRSGQTFSMSPFRHSRDDSGGHVDATNRRHENRRPGAAALVVAGAGGLTLGLVRTAFNDQRMFAFACASVALTVGLSAVSVRTSRMLVHMVAILFYYLSVSLLLIADAGADVTNLALIAIPVVWAALYKRVQVLFTALAAAVATLLVDAMAGNLSAMDSISLVVVWLMTGIGLAVGIRVLRSQLEQTIVKREHELQQNAILAMATEELYASFEADQVLQFGLQSAVRLVCPEQPDARALLFQAEDGQATLIASYSRALQLEDRTDPMIDNAAFPLSDIAEFRNALERNEDRVFELTPETVVPPAIEPVLAQLQIERALAHPIRIGSVARGFLAVVNGGGPQNFTESQREWMRRLVAILELAISRALLHEEQAAVDPLTTLFNRREYERRLNGLPRRMRYSLLALDVDRLKATNDTFGHGAGDDLLKAVSTALKSSVRRGDVAARIGGDEFAVLLPDADAEQSQLVAQRILDELAIVEVCGSHPSVSIGVAGYADGQTAGARSLAADKALYSAKKAGGNRYVFYHRPVAIKPKVKRSLAHRP